MGRSSERPLQFVFMPEETILSQTEIVRAATNDPMLSDDSFTLGDRTFQIVDLAYDDYIMFFTYLQPLFESFASGITDGVISTGANFSVSDLLKHCASSLPNMVCLMCRQTDPYITAEDVKKLGKNPFVLAAAVLKQIRRNRMIEDISDFFEQILPLLKAKTSK